MASTMIRARIYRNGDVTIPLEGHIVVSAKATLFDSGNLFVSDPVTYPLVNGAADFVLVATEESRTSYNFQIFEHEPDETDDGHNHGGHMLYQFDAVVPASLTPIMLTSLAQQSGLRYDQQDASLLTLANYILTSELFSKRLLDKLLNLRGSFSVDLVYRSGDAVLYDGDGYLYVSDLASRGNFPTNTAYWRKYVSKGDTGSATIGDNSAYSPVWQNSTTTPTRGALWNKIETLLDKPSAANTYAPLNSPSLTRATQDPLVPVAPTDNSTRLVDSAWVRNLTAPYSGQMPIGARVKWDNTLALPVKFLRANGSNVSRLVYANLYSIYGSTYGAGDGSTTFTLPTDPSFIVYTGV